MIYGDLFSAVTMFVESKHKLCRKTREGRFCECGTFVAVQLWRPRVCLWQRFKLVFIQQQLLQQ